MHDQAAKEHRDLVATTSPTRRQKIVSNRWSVVQVVASVVAAASNAVEQHIVAFAFVASSIADIVHMLELVVVVSEAFAAVVVVVEVVVVEVVVVAVVVVVVVVVAIAVVVVAVLMMFVQMMVAHSSSHVALPSKAACCVAVELPAFVVVVV